MKVPSFPIFILSALMLFGCSSHKKTRADMPVAHATLVTPSGASAGSVDFKEIPEGIRVMVMLSGLAPKTTHGLHVHEKGICEGPSYESAGGHFNPRSTKHGGPNSTKHHPGDFGNLTTDEKGRATKEIFIPRTEAKDLKIFRGKAVILHANADDLISQPSGNSGPRMACGLIF